ncbi:MAG: polysaccharide biosynthesis/export family protein [Defluviicoccus sp.]|nr:polysaccharide biosynthesis/export family protein [Defluviicoccus sp.]
MGLNAMKKPLRFGLIALLFSASLLPAADAGAADPVKRLAGSQSLSPMAAMGAQTAPRQDRKPQGTAAAVDQGEPAATWPGAESALKHQGATPDGVSQSTEPPPFGANLFARPFKMERPDALNPDYIIVPGDQIAVHVWGAAQTEDVAVVDAQGNIFITSIGPVKVAGTRSGDLGRKVREAVASVYSSNVEVYVNLLTSTPVEVFVTGAVRFPGQYAGAPTDSLLTYLHRAGGVDLERGSFRKVRVLRQNRDLKRVDLYDFLREGSVPSVRFADGDVILVGERGPSVTVEGPTLNPFRFELSRRSVPGDELATLARPLVSASHVGISGNRASGPFAVYVNYEQFRQFTLEDGDRLRFEADQQTPSMLVSLEGSYEGPSSYTVARNSTLTDFLDNVPVDQELAATQSIYLRRASIARQQKELLDRSLRQLEQSVLTAPTRSDGEAEIRVREAELVSQFVERARQVQPEGRVVVSEKGRPSNVRLEPGDVIVIPTRTDIVLIGGEVMMPQAIVYDEKFRASDYVQRAGGYTERADSGKVMIIRQNGAVEMGSDVVVQPGDQVVVMPAVEFKSLQVAKDIMQILYQIAISTAVVLTLL